MDSAPLLCTFRLPGALVAELDALTDAPPDHPGLSGLATVTRSAIVRAALTEGLRALRSGGRRRRRRTARAGAATTESPGSGSAVAAAPEVDPFEAQLPKLPPPEHAGYRMVLHKREQIRARLQAEAEAVARGR